jgi:hypothetical protein
MLMFGKGVTVITIVSVFTQPGPEVPVTVYVAVAAGETVIVLVAAPPGDQTYVLPPFPVSVTEVPTQVEVEVDVINILGTLLTFTITVSVLRHPFVPTPVTV